MDFCLDTWYLNEKIQVRYDRQWGIVSRYLDQKRKLLTFIRELFKIGFVYYVATAEFLSLCPLMNTAININRLNKSLYNQYNFRKSKEGYFENLVVILKIMSQLKYTFDYLVYQNLNSI